MKVVVLLILYIVIVSAISWLQMDRGKAARADGVAHAEIIPGPAYQTCFGFFNGRHELVGGNCR
jgi:hypothetical protein